jgi:hypothetical protein
MKVVEALEYELRRDPGKTGLQHKKPDYFLSNS